MAPFFNYHPSAFADLIADLTRDHRVARFDARGTGESTRVGPHDIETNSADLAVVIERAGPPAVVVTVGDGLNRAQTNIEWARRRGIRLGRSVSTILTPMSDEDLDLARVVIDAFNRGGIEATLDYADPEVEWWAPSGWMEESVYRGHEGFYGH